MKQSHKNVAVMKSILVVGSVLGVCSPLWATFKPKSMAYFYKIYSIGSAVFWILVTIWMIYAKQKYLSDSIISPVRFMDCAVHICLAVFSVSVILVSGYVHSDRLKTLFKHLDLLDERLTHDVMKSRRKIYYHFGTFNVFLLAFMISDATIWISTLGLKWYSKYYLTRVIQLYQCFLTVFFANVLADQLRDRFETLNQLLVNTIKGSDCGFWVYSQQFNVRLNNRRGVKEFSQIHTFLCEMVENFNSIFGFLFMFAALVSIVMILNFVVMMLAIFFFEIKIEGIEYGTNLLVVCTMGIVIIIVQTVILAWIGERLSNEASKTHRISYSILNSISLLPYIETKEGLRDDLLLLSMQSVFRKPCVRASGFFVVNYRMLGFMTATLTSYVIVAVQFLTQTPPKLKELY
ncbi:uncharacterized protein LOC132699670 [Cylas formicarius]|uniref:uncharacterized protein LOC132699670 n=1 Tax=Cylas formicarius TaxID=197179 RepID=UPI0029586716|nr:uncharacterized protein LOC132699670 [Cylas formicarius]XP_060522499.1 uncharacterized protein LOC132699670 [Cylas formicarius]XP_060522500.1 uncharacterized protein LOC132699670 [Cylas formicarius]XP_060522501.1 uncharacterized protein LOC132699670 [Cylas formicarius]